MFYANLLIVLFLNVAFPARCFADESWLIVKHKSSDTDKVMPLVRQGLSGIPASIKDALFAAGYKVIVTPSMLYGESQDTLERRSNYDVGSSNNIAGLFKPSEHALYIPEKASSGNEAPALQNSNDLCGVIRHEFGHAYDCFLTYPSQSPTFSQAFATDSSQLTNSQRTTFSYFSMQQPGTNSTELFAELFNIICSNDDRTLRSYDQNLYQSFPKCVQAILELSPDLKPHQFSGGANAKAPPTEFVRNGQAKSRNSAQASGSQSSSPIQTAARLIGAGSYAEAIPYLDAIITQDSNNGFAYNYRAYAHLASRNYKQAISDYIQVLRLNPKDLNAVNNLKLARQLNSK